MINLLTRQVLNHPGHADQGDHAPDRYKHGVSHPKPTGPHSTIRRRGAKSNAKALSADAVASMFDDKEVGHDPRYWGFTGPMQVYLTRSGSNVGSYTGMAKIHRELANRLERRAENLTSKTLAATLKRLAQKHRDAELAYTNLHQGKNVLGEEI